MVGAIGALLGAVLGVIGAYTLETRRAEADRKERKSNERHALLQRRKAVATCLLHDMETIESDLQQIFAKPDLSRLVIHRPQLFWDQLLSDVALFSPVSITKVAELFRRVDQFYQSYAIVEKRMHGKARDRTVDYRIKTQVAFALQMVPEAVKALQSEGGKIIGHTEWKTVTFPTLPDVPTPVFLNSANNLGVIHEALKQVDAEQ